ncbi:hypothetical protein [Mongoliibacter sp.]|uniref:hypothetical protein n=1 Tax=Mongoliibacter sp. TaxID=2022438 RepID=UPI00345C3B3A
MSIQKSFSQGFNNNEWVFGYCGSGQQNSYISFGKGSEPTVRNLPGTIVIGSDTGNVDNNSVVVDPITGRTLFYTNGVLVYNNDNLQIQGAPNGVNGQTDVRQGSAIGTLSYDPEGDKIFYLFYITPGGQLQYSVVDMNAAGGATGNQPPLGAVTTLNQTISNASGAITVVKNINSPSYLLSFEGGELISRRIEDAEGDFTQTSSTGLGFTPKAIIYNESLGKLILIPEDPSEDIIVLDFDANSGTFGASESVPTGGPDSVEGATFSPGGEYLYFSKGNELLRVPVNDLAATPEVIPLDNDVFNIYDIRVGPDGRLYYIYEEVEGGPQLVGRVDNPDEEDLLDLDINEDPFNGTDFCGRVFPQFAPNQDVQADVDFTWEPEVPCENNPIQLTSEINPENFRPVSFEWTFNPPLTDEDGEPIDIDFNQEHLLIPEEAVQGQSIDVTLTVTFEDGSSRTIPKTIPLTPNDLEADFSAQDTTVCEGACVDIGSLLEVQEGGGQGGENPNIGGPGGGNPNVGGPIGGGNYEYFWSNRRDEGWVSDTDNCVDLPGLYWVLVREPGAQCYAYAEIRVKIWDLPDQNNNIWYFGDGAGLDFNIDPNDPDGPIPRPVTHPNNIPAGTTTISDETGQVLFYTDGETVWDLNGVPMENGENIGGSNQASESVIAVPIPQQETVYYVFTTQRSADGTNRVKYSVVDIKAGATEPNANVDGIGNVVSKGNFLFSPSTEQSAALASGDTTWVLFHELGNNTFRAYPVTQFGIGSPVFSSVGSNHGFNTGVGTMKFSPDGNQVAVTIQDGACSRLEIFDFDQSSGRMTEYALLDLGCNNDEIYGVEFSNDGSRVFVSYLGSGGKIEEFLIGVPERQRDPDDPDAPEPDLSCADCFNNASNRADRENCILNSSIRNTLSTSGPFGAVQIGPDGQVYVARPGQSSVGQIIPGGNCNASNYQEDGVNLIGGTSSNLGLPAFVQQSGSSIPEPALSGPERICLDPDEGGIGLFEGGGEPDIDAYFWTIQHEDGEFELQGFGGAGEDFQELEHPFSRDGLFTVTLRVDRCEEVGYFEESIEVLVVAPPELTLPDDIVLCAGSPVELTAIEGYDPADELYDFEWRNAAGQLFGDSDSNTIEVTEESIYTVTVSYRIPDGADGELFNTCPSSKEVFVGPAFDFDLNQSAEEVCYDDQLVVFAPNTPLEGEWFYEILGSGNRVSLGRFFELELEPSSLPAPGQYEIIFIGEDPIIENCLFEKKAELIVYGLPAVDITILTDADDCDTPNGSFELEALTAIDRLEILETNQVFNNLSAGQVLPVFADLEPGLYTIQMEGEFGCEFVQTAVIQNLNPPAEIDGFTVSTEDEECTAEGVSEGRIIIDFPNGPASGSYLLVRQDTGEEFIGSFTNEIQLTIDVPGGVYAVEISDENGCDIPSADLHTVEEKEQAEFSIPSNVEACEVFTFAPSSPDPDLGYRLEDELGNLVNSVDGTNYEITQSGLYIMTAIPSGSDICPRVREIFVNISGPIDFDLVGPEIDCETGVSYTVDLKGLAPADVRIFWRNSNGEIISRNPILFPTIAGEYTLEVQPAAGGLCPPTSISFEVEEFEDDLEIELEALPFCGEDVFTIISIIGDLNNVAEINWYSVTGNTRTLLPLFADQSDVTIIEAGVYQVELINNFGCTVALEQIQIIKSDALPPVLEESYIICALEDVVFVLDPGEYQFYSWRLDGEEVADTPTFTPTEAGMYELLVFDDAGCEFSITFEVEEDCALKVVFPNAMRPSDPDRQFVLFANDFIDEVEVLIYNRWGELIYYCQNNNIPEEEPICTWDGLVNGQVVPIGTYPVLVRYRSINQNLTQTITRAITVIE